MNILDQIDHVVDGLCPCGGDPRPGSAYCSDDCMPNYRGEHTSSDTDGTAMRWRPDLVTEVDDTGLVSLGSMTFYEGRFNAQLFQRGIPYRGEPLTWHLRLNDGHRFVGTDLPNISANILDPDHEDRVAQTWARLERELANSQHVEAGPIDGIWDTIRHAYQQQADEYGRIIDQLFFRTASNSAAADEPTTYEFADRPARPGRMFIAAAGTNPTESSTWTEIGAATDDGISFSPSPATEWTPGASPDPDFRERYLNQFTRPVAPAPLIVSARLYALLDDIDRTAVIQYPREFASEEPQHPMLAAIERRKNRNTGPEQRQRAPRRLRLGRR